MPFFTPVPHLSWVVCLMPDSMFSLAGCWQVGENDEKVDGPEQFVGPYSNHQCHVSSQMG